MGQKYLYLLQQEISTWVYTQSWKMWFKYLRRVSKKVGGDFPFRTQNMVTI